MEANRIVRLAAFILGIVLAKLEEKEILTSYGIFNTYFLSQYAYVSVRRERLFWQILFRRVQSAAFLVLLGKAVRGSAWFLLTEGILACMFGFFTAASVANLGAKGLLAAAAGVVPQWLCYLAALTLYAQIRKSAQSGVRKYRADAKRLKVDPSAVGAYLFLFLLFASGILLETYVNPPLLQWVLKRLLL